jgi:hypothetical protein
MSVWTEDAVFIASKRLDIEVNDRDSAFTFLFWATIHSLLLGFQWCLNAQRFPTTLVELSLSLDFLDDEGVEHVGRFRGLGTGPSGTIIPLVALPTTF